MILRDFNERTRQLQILHSTYSKEIEPTTLGLQRTSDDAYGPISRYGHHLL